MSSFETFAVRAWKVVQSSLSDIGAGIPALTIMLTDTVWDDSVVQGRRLGLSPDQRGGPERLTGVVAGKTLSRADHSEVVVLVDAALFDSAENLGVWAAGAILSHELGHVSYAQERHQHLEVLEATAKPWDEAEMIAVVAAEEWRVERFAHILVDNLFTATAGNEQLEYRRWHHPVRVRQVTEFVPAYVDQCLDHIHAYRSSGDLSLLSSAMDFVIRASTQLANVVAMEDACRTGDMPVLLDEIEPSRASLLVNEATAPMLSYLHKHPMPRGRDEWIADRKRLRKLGGDGWMNCWKALGLTPEPHGDQIYIHVSEPILPSDA